VLGEPDLPSRPGYESNNARVANRPEVDAHVAGVFRTMTRDEAAERLRGARTAFGFVNEVADLVSHPALRRAEVMTPNGAASVVAPPAIVDGAPRRLGPVPGIGEQDAAIRAEFAAKAA
jgi:crotonobetainyl-CoA:carnitine CoA-transferase CaiB-like acyl-CoA transferase